MPNSLDYSDDVAAQQRAGYPEIQPVFLAVPPDEAYRRAMAVVTARGWEVLAGDDASHRIEATDTTRWFGFKDDVADSDRGHPEWRQPRGCALGVTRGPQRPRHQRPPHPGISG